MANATSMRISMIGIAMGGVALLVALVHFWAGPFAPQPSLERSVAETAVAIRDATVAALRGDEIKDASSTREFNLDKGIEVLAVVLGGGAIILAVVGFAKGESTRAAGGAAVLGAGAIAFKFAVFAVGAIVVAVLIAAVLGELGFD